jgi:hypothetical protein
MKDFLKIKSINTRVRGGNKGTNAITRALEINGRTHTIDEDDDRRGEYSGATALSP